MSAVQALSVVIQNQKNLEARLSQIQEKFDCNPPKNQGETQKLCVDSYTAASGSPHLPPPPPRADEIRVWEEGRPFDYKVLILVGEGEAIVVMKGASNSKPRRFKKNPDTRVWEPVNPTPEAATATNRVSRNLSRRLTSNQAKVAVLATETGLFAGFLLFLSRIAAGPASFIVLPEDNFEG